MELILNLYQLGSIKKAKGNYTLANKGMLWGDIY